MPPFTFEKPQWMSALELYLTHLVPQVQLSTILLLAKSEFFFRKKVQYNSLPSYRVISSIVSVKHTLICLRLAANAERSWRFR